MDVTYHDGYNNNCEDQRDDQNHTKIHVEAQFVQYVTFDIDIDLSDKNLVKKWYVNWNKLYVIFQDGTHKEYDADSEDCDVPKYPNIVNVFSQDEEDC